MKTPALREVYDFFGPKVVVDGVFQTLSPTEFAKMQASCYDFHGAELMHEVAKVLAVPNGERE